MTSSDGGGERPADTLPGYRTAQDVAGEEAVQRFVDALGPVGGHVADLVIEVVFGKLHGRPGMSHTEREIITLAVLAALGGAEEQLTMHLRISHRLGISPAKVIEVFAHTGAYAGFPRAVNAVETAKRFYGDLGMLPLEQQQH
ncbi:carboxymuconolactone decarboxylase family protein [Streptomyces leeuwenhoekii]|jgi:4-carboxymuconolactone decarboxylase|uniref:carboxymuconolactone decarboxylase family protein n=1 Tax=Streptomyces leeuwenhoekii TaxID=1437453 RepID=UPI00368A1125